MYVTLGYFYQKMMYNICGILTTEISQPIAKNFQKKLPNTNKGLKYYTEMLFYEVV